MHRRQRIAEVGVDPRQTREEGPGYECREADRSCDNTPDRSPVRHDRSLAGRPYPQGACLRLRADASAGSWRPGVSVGMAHEVPAAGHVVGWLSIEGLPVRVLTRGWLERGTCTDDLKQECPRGSIHESSEVVMSVIIGVDPHKATHTAVASSNEPTNPAPPRTSARCLLMMTTSFQGERRSENGSTLRRVPRACSAREPRRALPSAPAHAWLRRSWPRASTACEREPGRVLLRAKWERPLGRGPPGRRELTTVWIGLLYQGGPSIRAAAAAIHLAELWPVPR